MSKTMSGNRLVGFWFAAVAIIIVSVLAIRVNVGGSTAALLLTLSLVPPGIVLVLWRGAPPPTVGEILSSANSAREGRS